MTLVGIERGYEDLANAIVLSGVREYKIALKRLKREPNSESAKRAAEKGERFLLSPWFQMLTDVDPTYLIRKLKEEC